MGFKMKRFTLCDRRADEQWHVGLVIGQKRVITARTYIEKNARQARRSLALRLKEMAKNEFERMGYVKN